MTTETVAIHNTGLLNIFWPHYQVIPVCADCGWWGTASHLQAANEERINHVIGANS